MIEIIDIVKVIFDFIPIFTSVLCAFVLFLSFDLGIMNEKSAFKRILLFYFILGTISALGDFFYNYFPVLFTQFNSLSFLAVMLSPIVFCDYIGYLVNSKHMSIFHYLIPCLIFGIYFLWSLFVPFNYRLALTKSGNSFSDYTVFSIFTFCKPFLSSLFGIIYTLWAARFFIGCVLRSDLQKKEVLTFLKSIAILIATAILLQLLVFIGIILPHNDYFPQVWSVVITFTTLVFYLLLLYHLLKKDFDPLLQTKQVMVKQLKSEKEDSEQKVDSSSANSSEIATQSIQQPTIGKEKPPAKKLNKKDFERFIRTHKPYLNPEYKITDMVVQLDVSRAYVSQFINGAYGVNFNVYINRCRLAELDRLKKLAANKGKKTADLILLAGFPNYRTYMRTKNVKE